MKRGSMFWIALIGFTFLAFAGFPQTVTVDNTNLSPDNVSTFDSVMMALHSFQASGAVTAASPGGIGVNHGNAAPNVINIIATGVIYDEIMRVDERADAAEDHQCIMDEDFTINGVASGGNDKPILAAADYGTTDDDCFEIRTDVNFEINDIIFMYNPANPVGTLGYGCVTIDRLNTTAGTPSEFSFNDCVFTSADNTGDPTVTNADEAFIDRNADISTGNGGSGGRMVQYFPDENEGMKGTFNRCVFSHNTSGDSSRYALVYCYFGGTGSTWTEEVGCTVNSCIFTHGPGPGIELQCGGNSSNANLQYLNITGTDAAAGGLATGAPTVIAYNQHSAYRPPDGCGIFSLAPTNNNALSGDWNNLWIVGCAGAAIRGDILDDGGKLYYDLTDVLIANNNHTAATAYTVRATWGSPTATHPASNNWTNVTIVAGNESGGTGQAVNLPTHGSATGTHTINMSNVILAQSAAATDAVIGIQNDGGTAVNVSDSALVTAGPNALGAGTHANTGTGSINLTNVINSDPIFAGTYNIHIVEFYAVRSNDYLGAGPGGADLVGGRYWAAPPASANIWNLYE